LSYGYVLIWVTEGHSALLALQKHAAQLQRVAAELPPTTINPVDASIPYGWGRADESIDGHGSSQ